MTDYETNTPAEILTPGSRLYHPAEAPMLNAEARTAIEQLRAARAIVVVHARGKFRRAHVLSVGPRRTRIAYRSPSTGRRTEKDVQHKLIYVEKQPAGEPYGTTFAGVIREPGGQRGYGHQLEPDIG